MGVRVLVVYHSEDGQTAKIADRIAAALTAALAAGEGPEAERDHALFHLLLATGVADNFGIFFGANNQVNGGNGNPLNDGLRCAGGGLVRLVIKMSDADGYIDILAQGSSLRGYRAARSVAEASGAELAETLERAVPEVKTIVARIGAGPTPRVSVYLPTHVAGRDAGRRGDRFEFLVGGGDFAHFAGVLGTGVGDSGEFADRRKGVCLGLIQSGQVDLYGAPPNAW